MNTMITRQCAIPGCTGELKVKRRALGLLPPKPTEDGKYLHVCTECDHGFAWLSETFPRPLIPGVDDVDTDMEDVNEASI